MSEKQILGGAAWLVAFNLIGVFANGDGFIWDFYKVFWCFEILAAVVATFYFVFSSETEKANSTVTKTSEALPVNIQIKDQKPEFTTPKTFFTKTLDIKPLPEKPPDPPLTAEELKRRALKQITGKEF